ncbi:sensor histidine kinase [Tengunoibacter tsumagoiensis]|nr:ATP-binding protein [Tengunoibacter tsumagoiensis]
MISSQYPFITTAIFPIWLGYAILRYQMLVLDSYVRRAISSMVGILALAILVYLSVTAYEILPPHLNEQYNLLYVVCVTCIITALAPAVWLGSRRVADRLFFSEVLHYRRIIERPEILANQKIDLIYASNLITSAAINTFGTDQVALLVFDESGGYYHLVANNSSEMRDDPALGLLQMLCRYFKPQVESRLDNWLERQLPALQRLAAARRPQLLSELIRSKEQAPRGLSRYISSSEPTQEDSILLAPLRVQGSMIGILVLGRRGESQMYAGPDFEIVEILLARFSSVLETARLYYRAHQHAQLLNSLYQVGTMPSYVYKTLEDVIRTYAKVAYEATETHIELWLYDQQKGQLRQAIQLGHGPTVTAHLNTFDIQEADWHAQFIDANSDPTAFTVTSLERPTFPLAWLPLVKGEWHWGIVILNYARPHFFAKEEMHILEMFANQWVAALENKRMTSELVAAYERQQELDHLKDRFIMTASHELRTPLTAVMGYVELLYEYNDTLPQEAQVDFIERARQGCDELTTLVGTIIDASQLQIEIEQLKLVKLSLRNEVQRVLTMLGSIFEKEKREYQVLVDSELSVYADQKRVQQIFFNLLSNALRYSKAGSQIEVYAEAEGAMVKIGVRDYGVGIPLVEQEQLFERFVRLEREINSPVRGAGLGLAVCKQLIEAMGGSIWLESSGEEGSGSCFWFTLPTVSEDLSLGGKSLQVRRV